MSVDKFGTRIKSSTTFPINNEKIDFMGKRLTNVGYPADLNDAVNKQYISEIFAYLNKSIQERYDILENKLSKVLDENSDPNEITIYPLSY
jgi:hypothetical protein